jgi:hypothetical protein
MVSILQQECPILVDELHVLIFEDCTVLIAENRQQDFVFEFALDRMPLDVERRGVPRAGAVFQYIAPPPVQRLADAHVGQRRQPEGQHRPDGNRARVDEHPVQCTRVSGHQLTHQPRLLV